MTITLFLFLFFDVRGIVSDPSGRPVEGAQVACGSETKTTDAHGAFDLPHACEATVTKEWIRRKARGTIGIGRQSGKAGAGRASDRVVVTATRAPLAVEESGVATDVFTAKDFEPARGAFVQNLLRDVPGVNVVQTGRNGGLTSVFARGGESDSALVLLDGIPLTEPGGGLDFAHLTSRGAGSDGSDPRAGERAVRSGGVERGDPDVH